MVVPLALINTGYSVIHAALQIADSLDIKIDPWDSANIPTFTSYLQNRFGRPRNDKFNVTNSSDLDGVSRKCIHHGSFVQVRPPTCLNGTPGVIPNGTECFLSNGDINLITIQDGWIFNIGGVPLMIGGDGKSIIRDCSSYYAELMYYYDFSFADLLEKSDFVDGTVFMLFIDIDAKNYAHWITDYLPRIAHLRNAVRHKDVFLATPPLSAGFQRETLRLCGFDESRIICLDYTNGIRAREIIALDDTNNFYHPAHSAAPWAIDYLRSSIGFPSTVAAGITSQSCKLYVSRADAQHRSVTNEDELIKILGQFNYEVVIPSQLTYAEQIAKFASASHIIGPHGAGLTNLIFSRPDAQVIELFPPGTIGTPGLFILCTGTNRTYYSYITNADTDAVGRENLLVDIEEFQRVVGPHL